MKKTRDRKVTSTEKAFFVLENKTAIRRVVREVKAAGVNPADIVVYIGDARRKDFMDDYRALNKNNPDLEAQLEHVRKHIKDAVLCTYIVSVRSRPFLTDTPPSRKTERQWAAGDHVGRSSKTRRKTLAASFC